MRLVRHLRRHDAIQRLTQGAAMALALNLIVAFTARLWPLWYRETLVSTLMWSIGISAALAGVVGRFWPYPLPAHLRRLDLGLDLADRLTTLWELSQGHITASPTLTQVQREETLRHLRGVAPSEAFPLRPRRRAVMILLALSLLVILSLGVPNPQEVELAYREAQAQARHEALARLEQLEKVLTESPTLTEAQREAALQALNEALTTLRDPATSEAERQLALDRMEQQLAELRSLDHETQAARIARLAEAASASRPLSAEEAAFTIVNPLTDAIQRGDLDAAAAYLRALTDPEGEALSTEEILALADTFSALADHLQQTDPALAEQFRQIAQEMYTQDAEGARDALQQASDTLSQIDQAYARDRTLEQAQAHVQSAREQLRQAWSERPATSQSPWRPSDAASGAQAEGIGGQGQATGLQRSHEDSGSSAPYAPDDVASRLGDQGDHITLPRSVEQGEDAQPTLGQSGPARVPYQEVYADYAESAEAQLSQRAYPPGLRAYIQTYFSTLEK
jgi:hypothetical protein